MRSKTFCANIKPKMLYVLVHCAAHEDPYHSIMYYSIIAREKKNNDEENRKIIGSDTTRRQTNKMPNNN